MLYVSTRNDRDVFTANRALRENRCTVGGHYLPFRQPKFSEAELDVLLEQQKDLSSAIDQLLEDIEGGRKYMKVYKQMKMYNDPSLNPVLYGKK